MSDFDTLGLDESILRAVRESGYAQPTPIQAQAIPLLLEQRDVLGCAQTGTGKTAAFVLPVLQRLLSLIPERGGRVPRALILAPTRELASQIGESIKNYAQYLPVRHDVIYGGVNIGPQIDRLRRGVDLIVATPGRLLEILDRGNIISLKNVDFFVLDEADRMLDMGFIRDIRRVITHLPARRQTMFFSATMPKEIQELADSILHRPVRVEVAPPATTGEKITQLLRYVEGAQKPKALVEVLQRIDGSRCIVFTRTKHGANRVVKVLDESGIPAMAIHGNKSQNHRERALSQFKDGEVTVLIATDIASRGIDVDGVTHVINYDLPDEADVYVHRIGRTGRAGRSGVAIAFCSDEERALLFDIVKLTQQPIEIVDESGEVVGRYEVPEKGNRRPPSPVRPVRGQRPQAGRDGGHGAKRPHPKDGERAQRRDAAGSANQGLARGERPARGRFDDKRTDAVDGGPRPTRREPAPGSRPPRTDGPPTFGPRRDGPSRPANGPARERSPYGETFGKPRAEQPKRSEAPQGANTGEGTGNPRRVNRAPKPPQDYSAAVKPPARKEGVKAALPVEASEGLRRNRR